MLKHVTELGREVIDHRGVRMFGKNTVASTIAFLLDLLILWALVELLAFQRIPAAVVAFLVPMVIFYVLERIWVFKGTRRGVATGLAYFMINVGIGFLVMLAVYWMLLQFTGMHYLLARLAASAVSGVVIFLLNGFFNFKQL